MRASAIIWANVKSYSCFCSCNRFIYRYSSNLITYKSVLFPFKPNNTSLLVKEVMYRLPYSTQTNTNNQEGSDKVKSQSKKKKEFKVYITLLGGDGNIISVSTVEDATKLALRRNLRLVKEMDLDPKTGRAVYKLMTESDYLKADKDWTDSKAKKGKEKFVKGDKVVSLTSTTAAHDILTKTKMMQKWLNKRYEVRVVITGDIQSGENVFKIIEKEIGTDGRIVQKRSKGQDIRFQILPPKPTEEQKSIEQLTKSEVTEDKKEE